MAAAVAKRVGAALAVAFAVTLVTFFVLRVLPGNPALLVLGVDASPDKVAQLSAAMGLDEPVPRQYLSWLAGLFGGDWGTSRIYGDSVLGVIGRCLPVTVELSLYAMAIAVVVSAVLGVWGALRPGSFVDIVARTVMQLGAATPAFWLAVLLMLFFAVRTGWFPVSGFDASGGLWGSLRSLTLPAVALAAGECGILIRTFRSATMGALEQDFMLQTQVKGLGRMRSVCGYALRAALVAPLTVIGLQLAKLAGGTVVVESVFALPGLGGLLLVAIQQRDLVLVEGIVILVTLSVVAVSLVTDLLVMAVNPQVRSQELRGGE